MAVDNTTKKMIQIIKLNNGVLGYNERLCTGIYVVREIQESNCLKSNASKSKGLRKDLQTA